MDALKRFEGANAVGTLVQVIYDLCSKSPQMGFLGFILKFGSSKFCVSLKLRLTLTLSPFIVLIGWKVT
jgi:hypothetical protein